ncbi:MAG: type III secretion system inner membrane ring lipoprotein SctJ [Anaerolineae bacterium]
MNSISLQIKRLAFSTRFMWVFFIALLTLTGCENKNVIINDVEEREANEIIVFLASKGISAEKTPTPTPAGGGTEGAMPMWSIGVPTDQMTDAMAYLNQNGLPRKKGTNLLQLFAKQGLMSSEKEETIRYQAGLAEQIANTIRKIDGVIDADVQLSFPPPEATAPGSLAPQTRVTAAVYVKHQGVLDDPNSHLVTKIKRLVAGSVNGLDINDVTVIPDRSRYTDITLNATAEMLTAQAKEYVSIWSIVMNKESASRFRTLFFTLIFISILLALCTGWLIWKVYPLLRNRGGFKELLNPLPLEEEVETEEEESSDEAG